jgi:hypothetical protein
MWWMAGYSICLIGNSHLAALAQAWRKDRLGARAEVTQTFFGMGGGYDWELILQDSALVPPDEEGKTAFQQSSRGRSAIEIEEYDAFVIYGVGFQVKALLPLFLDEGTLISRESVTAALCNRHGVAASLKLLELVRSLSRAPVIVCPQPFQSKRAFPASFFAQHPRLSQPEYFERVEEEFRAAAESLCIERGGEFLAQDESTWALPCFTRDEFALCGTTWRAEIAERTPKGIGNGKHMNGSYGAVVLRKILQRLDEISDGAVMGTVLVSPPVS